MLTLYLNLMFENSTALWAPSLLVSSLIINGG